VAAAAAVIGALSRPGDLVAVPLPGDAVFKAAAAAAARRVTSPAAPQCPRRGAAPACGPALACSLAPLRATGSARLVALAVVTDCSGCGQGAATGPLLYAACRRLLRPGGLLAVVTSAARDPGRAGRVIADARAAGLVYAQHVIAVHAPVDGDRLTSPWPRQGAGTASDLTHLPVHTDLLLFARPEGTRHD
jgi:hypothetical protein